MTGMFITFEGGEGSGKTTQIRLLADHLHAQGRDVVVTREPGGTPEAEKIRELIVRRDGGGWSPWSECLLFFAARAHHVENLIKPALAEGKIVLCDRFVDSTIVYQGIGKGVDRDKLRRLYEDTLGDFAPDMTFILDIPVDIGLKRAAVRQEGVHIQEDRFEKLGTDFHEKIRHGFLDLAAQNMSRCKVIDAAHAPEVVANEIKALLST